MASRRYEPLFPKPLKILLLYKILITHQLHPEHPRSSTTLREPPVEPAQPAGWGQPELRDQRELPVNPDLWGQPVCQANGAQQEEPEHRGLPAKPDQLV